MGWYSTGEEVNDSSILFHDFYGQEVERPVHLLLDLGLGESRMSCKVRLSLARGRVGLAVTTHRSPTHSASHPHPCPPSPLPTHPRAGVHLGAADSG